VGERARRGSVALRRHEFAGTRLPSPTFLPYSELVARKLTYVLVWLALTAEVEGYIFDNHWETWLTWVGTVVFKAIPGIRLVPWDLAVIFTWLATMRKGAKNQVPAIAQSLRITFISLAALWVWGVLRGGSAYQTYWQLHNFVMQFFTALLVAATCRTTAHIETLGKVVVFATIYRACVLLAFYFLVAKDLPKELPSLTDHADSVLFVSGLMLLLIAMLERRTGKSVAWLLLAGPVIITAIVLNNRRIAWLDVGVSLFLTYLLMPKNKVKRRINKTLLILSPVLIAYVGWGWGHPTGIFKPVGSVSTMFGENQDTSSLMRDIENYNLMRSLKTNPLLGMGWGHEYIEEVRAFDISSIFPQYRYLPHNSLLGLIAFTGMIGFAGIWQIVVVATFLHARVYRLARDPILRIAGLGSIVTFMVVVVQMWGDVGLSHLMVNVMMGVGIGVAARLPTLAGVWPTSTKSKQAAVNVEAEPAAGHSQAGNYVQN
jgi:hypothetical protein